ncbi:S1 RNA-binding domain-containing protein, partial [Candidatus Gottesmanbacteria bacterium]|nr:S1 RNA-binding domain-containing protein [Candidatus Gottesmanbacteria bacterium]
SQMSTGYVASPNDVVALGQKVKVRVMEIDDQRRVNLSMLFGDDAKKVSPPRERRDLPAGRHGFGARPAGYASRSDAGAPRRGFDRRRRY